MPWRNGLNCMSQRFEAALKNNFADISHDVTFVVGKENCKISCHKLFLSIASPVFEAMFSQRHNPKARGVENTEQIKISDSDATGFENLITYIYSGKLDVNVRDVATTMYAADKYEIPELIEYCSQVMKENLSIENCITIYQTAVLLNDKKLEEIAWKCIEKNSGILLNSEEFLEMSEDTLCNFLKFDHITTIKSELDVFNATLRWANRQCERLGIRNSIENIKEILLNIIQLIRFPAMDADEFRSHVEPTGIFNQNECLEMYTYFEMPIDQRIKTAMKYPSKKRTGLAIASFCSVAPNDTRYQEITRGPGHFDRFAVTGNGDSLKLKSVGIVLAQNDDAVAEAEVKVILKQFDACIDDYKIICDVTKTLSRVPSISEIEFDDCVHITTNISYLVEVQQLEQETFVAGFVKSLQQSSPILLNIPENQLRVTYSPVHHVIWSLEFE